MKNKRDNRTRSDSLWMAGLGTMQETPSMQRTRTNFLTCHTCWKWPINNWPNLQLLQMQKAWKPLFIKTLSPSCTKITANERRSSLRKSWHSRVVWSDRNYKWSQTQDFKVENEVLWPWWPRSCSHVCLKRGSKCHAKCLGRSQHVFSFFEGGGSCCHSWTKEAHVHHTETQSFQSCWSVSLVWQPPGPIFGNSDPNLSSNKLPSRSKSTTTAACFSLTQLFNKSCWTQNSCEDLSHFYLAAPNHRKQCENRYSRRDCHCGPVGWWRGSKSRAFWNSLLFTLANSELFLVWPRQYSKVLWVKATKLLQLLLGFLHFPVFCLSLPGMVQQLKVLATHCRVYNTISTWLQNDRGFLLVHEIEKQR